MFSELYWVEEKRNFWITSLFSTLAQHHHFMLLFYFTFSYFVFHVFTSCCEFPRASFQRRIRSWVFPPLHIFLELKGLKELHSLLWRETLCVLHCINYNLTKFGNFTIKKLSPCFLKQLEHIKFEYSNFFRFEKWSILYTWYHKNMVRLFKVGQVGIVLI